MVSENAWPWLQIVRNKQVNSSAEISQFLSASLLAAGDGTEVIYHQLTAGTLWNIRPNSVDMMETIFVTNGALQTMVANEPVTLAAGDSIALQSVPQDIVFQACVDTDFLYISSKPVYEQYSKALASTQNLAIQIEETDGYTSDHCKRIMKLALSTGRALQLDADELYRLQFGAFFHDVGKVKIPLEILNKKEPLTNDDWNIIKQHPTYGEQILKETDTIDLVNATPIVAQHHERHDGSGYPRGLAGNEICIGAAIIAVADSYDAMTSTRIYRTARSRTEATEEIQSLRGQLYHPDVVDAFQSVISLQPGL